MTFGEVVGYLVALALPVWLIVEQGVWFWQQSRKHPETESKGHRGEVPSTAVGSLRRPASMTPLLPPRAA